MFYDQLEKLCKEVGISITAATLKAKLSKGNIRNWKSGAIPSGEILMKFADYFGCSTDYLLGRTDNPEVNK